MHIFLICENRVELCGKARLLLARAPALVGEGSDGVEARVGRGGVEAEEEALEAVARDLDIEALDEGGDPWDGQALQDLGFVPEIVEVGPMALHGFDGEDSEQVRGFGLCVIV
jgi:hypothetical protein